MAATKSKSPARVEIPPFEQTSEIDEDGNLTAKIFGEEFKLSTDVNSWMLVRGAGGDLGALGDLVLSLIVVEPEEGETLPAARRREKARFNDLLSSQKNLTVEKLMELVGAMTESAGNDLEE